VAEDNPCDVWELSRHRYEEALARVEAALQIGWSLGDPDLLNEMRIIRMVGMHRTPWWGAGIDPEDSSVTVGVMMRNAFEAVGDAIDLAPTGDKPMVSTSRHWFTQMYLGRWRQGKKEYYEWLDTLSLPRPPDEGQ
jgi:hypothetical protein